MWIYDLRTNKHFTLKTNPLKREDLDEFVKVYNPANRNKRKATWSSDRPDGRWRVYDYDKLIARDKFSEARARINALRIRFGDDKELVGAEAAVARWEPLSDEENQ